MSEEKKVRSGDEVRWKWGQGYAKGKVQKVYRSKVTRTIKGKKITRKASAAKPAYYIAQRNGGRVLKSHTEVAKA